MPVILAWFPSFVLWVIFGLCRYRNTKRVMLTTFAEMQELGRQVESVSSHSKVSILYSVSCRADLSEISILKLHNTSIRLCLVPVRRFPSPSPSIRFRWLTFSHGPRDPKRFGREEKWGLGTRQNPPLYRRWVFTLKPICRCRRCLKVTLHGTIRNDDFNRNTGLKCWNNVAAIRNNVTTML